SGAPSVSGTFNYTVTMTGGCTGGANTASGTILIGAANVIYDHTFDNLPNSNTAYTASPLSSPGGVFATGLSGSVWTATSSGSPVSFSRINSGIGTYALAFNPPANAPSALTLTFTVNPQYSADITSFNFWRYRQQSGSPGISSITINGTTVYGGEATPTVGGYLGTTCVSNPVNNITGTVTVVINLTASSVSQGNRWFYLDEFILNGTVTSPDPYQEVYLHNFNNNPNGSPYTTSPTATTGLPTGVFNSNFVAGSSSWTSSTGTLTNTGDGSGGTDIALLTPLNATSSLTLTFSVQCGYILDIDAFDFRQSRQTSICSNISSITINGTTVYNGSTAPIITLANIGVTGVPTTLDNITGQVTIVINLTASSESAGNRYFYLDDFTLYGVVVANT
ncbi:MAG: hypothetical protein ACKOSR_07205, partial [Flavobacteriales bacterium]